MHKLLAPLALAAALVAAPVALHADTMMTGQFSIQGSVENVGTTLFFNPATIETGNGTQTGSFATILGETPQLVTGGTPGGVVPYSPYIPGSAFLDFGSFDASISTLTEMTSVVNGQTIYGFGGTGFFSNPGYLTTPGTFTFSTQQSGVVTFSATALTVAPVPEPSSLALFGTGILGLAGLVSKKFLA